MPRPEDGTLPEASLIGPLIVATPSLDSLARSVSQDSRHRDLKRPAVFGGIIRLRERERASISSDRRGRPAVRRVTHTTKEKKLPLPLLWSWVWPLFSCCSQSLCFLQLLLFALRARCSLSISLSPTWPDIIQTNLGPSRALAPCLLPIRCRLETGVGVGLQCVLARLPWEEGSRGGALAAAAAFIGLVKIDFLLDPIESGRRGGRRGWRAAGGR